MTTVVRGVSTIWFAAMSDATLASAIDDASRGPRASWQVVGRVVLALAFVAILLAGVSQSWSNGRAANQQDFFQYWAVGRLAGTGVTDIYSDPARHTLAQQIQADAAQSGSTAAVEGAARWDVLETYGTPFLYALFGRLSTGDYDVDFDRLAGAQPRMPAGGGGRDRALREGLGGS